MSNTIRPTVSCFVQCSQPQWSARTVTAAPDRPQTPSPAETLGLTELQFLSIPSASISGPIPSVLQNLQSLTVLNLGNNRFTGPIPEWIGNLRNLRSLYLYRNQLNGTIPNSLWGLTEMVVLSLERNQLSGRVPEDIEKMRNLDNLNLSNNQLAGPIPTSLGKIPTLNETYLDSNFFGGADFPESLYGINVTSVNNNCFRRSEVNTNTKSSISRYNSTRTVAQCTSAFKSAGVPVPSDIGTSLITTAKLAIDPTKGREEFFEMFRFLMTILGPVLAVIVVAAVVGVALNKRWTSKRTVVGKV
ncbi:hypothetical protein BC829DRAFT_449235 [Chytridium lagenaria]|nr:hypothetical protein BC829DRAFT_449235 [Chytridium lagenaria]